jgi:outer membrane protein TolC
VSVAAETANAYLQLRYQERRLAQAEADAASRAETARLIDTLGRAGLSAPAQVALASASAADGAAALTELRAGRDQQIKALVALTGLDETALRSQLKAADGASRARQLRHRGPAGRSAGPAPRRGRRRARCGRRQRRHRQRQGRPLPAPEPERLHHPLRLNTDGDRMSATTWSIGPTLSMPLIDGGRIGARWTPPRPTTPPLPRLPPESARRRREVEQALVRLDAATARKPTRRAARDYRVAFTATEARQRAGFASLMELEESRRTLLAADTTLAGWEQERVAAWVALYRAVGGGWPGTDPTLLPRPPGDAR